MIHRNEVLSAYSKYLDVNKHRIEVENYREETLDEVENRMEVTERFNTLELQYEAQFRT